MLAIVVETTERVRSERRREALMELDSRLRDCADTADHSFAASEVLGRALGVARVGYGVLDPQARTILVDRNWSAPNFADVAGVHDFAEYGSYIDDLLNGSTVANEDVEIDPRTSAHVASFKALGIRAHLDVPLTEGGRAVAGIFAHSDTPRLWTSDEITLVREFAQRTRAAIARRAAEQELRFALRAGRLGAWSLDLSTGELTTSEICRSRRAPPTAACPVSYR